MNSGICDDSRGYRIDSVHQAVWEAMHAQTCAVDPPFTCEPRLELLTDPGGDLVGGALLFALRVNTATYRGFADDMATHIACNRGEAAYAAFNEILCHHRIRDCGAPTPVVCKTCGNGIAELDEACDGDDLAGKTCVDLGFSGGVLMCDANCTFDDSQCLANVPTTGMDSAPTTDSKGTATGVDSGESGVGEGAEDGCGCSTDNSSSAWLSTLLGGLLSRRRRVLVTTLSALLLCVSGCGDGHAGDPDTGSAGETLGTSGTGTSGDVPQQVLGAFHLEGVEVGYINPGMESLVFRANMLVDRDGTLLTHRFVCEEQDPVVQEFTWMLVDGQRLDVVPKELKPDGTFEFLADPDVTSVQVMSESCDELLMKVEYAADSGKSTATLRWFSGSICAKPLGGVCHYELVWCDGSAPPDCVQE